MNDSRTFELYQGFGDSPTHLTMLDGPGVPMSNIA